MKHDYYKNYRETIPTGNRWANSYFGFVKKQIDLPAIIELLKKKIFDSEIIVTENFIIFRADAEKKKFQEGRLLKNVIAFAIMSYKNYKVTKTAKNIIVENSINEKDFSSDNYISVHNERLSVETKQKEVEISLELKNINIPIDQMENERNREIEKRIMELIS
jgi:hypothetical protein